MPTYWWKLKPEITWSVSLAVMGYLLQVLADPEITTAATWADWRKILLAAIIGCLRAGIGAAIAAMGPGGFKPDDPPGPVAPPQPAPLAGPERDYNVPADPPDHDWLDRAGPHPRG